MNPLVKKIAFFLLAIVGMIVVLVIFTFITENLVIGLIAMNIFTYGLIYFDKHGG